MKTPINCPFCGDILRSEFIPSFEGISMLEKKCDKKLNHKIILRAYTANDAYINHIRIPLTKNSDIYWFLGQERVEIITVGKLDLILPFWEPDLSNYSKLLEKIRTYILFS